MSAGDMAIQADDRIVVVGPVVVQLHSATGACWETTFGDPKKNDSLRFRASSDGARALDVGVPDQRGGGGGPS